MSHSAANTAKTASLNTGDADFDRTVALIWPAVAAGGNLQASLEGRWTDASNYLRLNAICFASGGHAFVNPDKVVAGVATSLGTTKDLGVYTAGASISLRLRLEDDNLKGKAWLTAGGEPGTFDWNITGVTISGPGKLALRSFRGAGNTNTSPQVKWDNLTSTTLVGTIAGLVTEYLRTHETATNSAGNVAVNSAALGPIVAGAPTDPIWLASDLPSVSGTSVEGAILTCDPGTVLGASPTIAYQWETSTTKSPGSESNVSGETAATHTPASGTAGAYRRCNVAATIGGVTTHQWTPWLGPIASGASSSAPVFTTPPSISGTTTAGDPLTLDPGVVTGTPAPSITQQWQTSIDSGVTYLDITGQQDLTYLLQSGDAGSYIRAAVTATNSSGSTIAYTSPVGVIVLPSDFPNLNISVTLE
jgi:hypothetical protein